MTLSVAIGHRDESCNNSRIINWKGCGLSDRSLIEIPPPHGATAPRGSGPPHYRGFTITLRHITLRHITLRHTTLGRTLLDERSVGRTNRYLTTHNTHKRQKSVPLARFEPTIPTTERPQAHTLDRSTTWIGNRDNIQIFTWR